MSDRALKHRPHLRRAAAERRRENNKAITIAAGSAGRVTVWVLLMLVVSLVAPQQSALGQQTESVDIQSSCTVTTPTVTSQIAYWTGVRIEAEMTVTCDQDYTISWQFRHAKTCASQPSHTDCQSVGGVTPDPCSPVFSADAKTVQGSRNDQTKIDFGQTGLDNFATYGYQLRASITYDSQTVSSSWNPGTTSCSTFEPRPPPPYAPKSLDAVAGDSSATLRNAELRYGYWCCGTTYPIFKWQYRYKCSQPRSGCAWSQTQDVISGSWNMPTTVVGGLVNGTGYIFQVRAVARITSTRGYPGQWSLGAYVTPSAPTQPGPTQPGPTQPGPTQPGPTQSGTTNQSGPSPGPAQPAQVNHFTDDEGSLHETDINILRSSGITSGCDSAQALYCPDDPVTRAQMATFLARAMKLEPPEDPDVGAFEDIVGNVHEDDIRAIAARGITKGCNESGTLYCPDDPVTRAQMATFLARALELEPPEDPDVGAFEDIVGNVHEDDIRAIAARGITKGCNESGTLYCPDDPVTRGQMASFLVRAFELASTTA